MLGTFGNNFVKHFRTLCEDSDLRQNFSGENSCEMIHVLFLRLHTLFPAFQNTGGGEKLIFFVQLRSEGVNLMKTLHMPPTRIEDNVFSILPIHRQKAGQHRRHIQVENAQSLANAVIMMPNIGEAQQKWAQWILKDTQKHPMSLRKRSASFV